MLRRLVLTASASVAALVAAMPVTAAADPPPLRLPVPLPLPVPLLSGPDKLTVTVSETGLARTDGTYELQCGPTGGTHPAAQDACDRLDELAREGENPFAPVPRTQMCTQQMGGRATAHITGIWRGQRVDAAFSRTNGCEISRWKTMQPVLPKTRS
ncbi:SSI family serine proteinase inhibitor [Streptomyces sp. NPDC052236]|uniref:SSI family serine proteinase inhibitor n=1 Tax=Streptomyces sp. NPDC052236 TaxID=3365686 RepID=UPI0037D550C5